MILCGVFLSIQNFSSSLQRGVVGYLHIIVFDDLWNASFTGFAAGVNSTHMSQSNFQNKFDQQWKIHWYICVESASGLRILLFHLRMLELTMLLS